MIHSTTTVEAALELIDVEHVALTKRAPLPDHRTIGFAAPPKVRTPSSSNNGRCSVFASSHGARIQTPRSS
jgi:hypothetical protein